MLKDATSTPSTHYSATCKLQAFLQNIMLENLLSADTSILSDVFPSYLLNQSWNSCRICSSNCLQTFRNYCQRTWIGTLHTPPRFAHELWNQHSNVLELLPRSLNIIEGWHQGFASMMGRDKRKSRHVRQILCIVLCIVC